MTSPPTPPPAVPAPALGRAPGAAPAGRPGAGSAVAPRVPAGAVPDAGSDAGPSAGPGAGPNVAPGAAPDAAPAFAAHDHRRCVRDALAAAEAACLGRGARLTPVRRRALEILLEGHAAVGAYDLLQRLAAEGLGSQPPVAYRALHFLVGQGLAHRIESADAFVACTRPGAGEPHVPAFLVCRSCRAVSEGEAGPLGAEVAGFAVERRVVEAEGLCPLCQEAAP